MTYFVTLIRVVNPSLEQKTHMRKNIHVETKVTMALAQLNSESSLQMGEEVYGIAKSIALIIMREFCSTIRKHSKPLVILN
jgi:hypothetical protein